MMNKSVLLMIAIVLASALVFADDANGSPENKADNITAKGFGALNMTYGSCVSEAAKIRNVCYEAAKEQAKSCAAAANGSDGRKDKAMMSQCKSTSKDGSNQCKKAFKATKKDECGKIKASFMEKLRYVFA